MRSLAEIGDRLATQLRERGEPQAEAEADAAIAVLGAAMASYLTSVCADPAHPRFMPGPGYYQHIGTPNPDTVYRTATIDGAGTYRLSGDRGTAPNVTLMPFGPPTASGVQTFPPFDFAELTIEPDGRFDVVLSPKRPPHHEGDWWQLDRATRTVMLRSVSNDWGRQRDPAVAIVRLDTPPRRPRPSAERLAARLETLPALVERSLTYGLRHVDDLHADGTVNTLRLVDYSATGGLAAQWYHEGIFVLDEDEALLIEVEVGAACEFSLALTDRLFGTLDWTNAQTSLNQRQAAVDRDGVLRAVVAPKDPGVQNWLDTTGYSTGVIQCRWIGLPSPPNPSVQVVASSQIPLFLPDRTPTLRPEQRRAALLVRNGGAQLRSLW